MGPKGGDELNLIEPGKNYGWADVSYGDNYDGSPIPKPPTRPEFQEPALYWDPVIAPAGLAFYEGELFPGLEGFGTDRRPQTQSLSQVDHRRHDGPRGRALRHGRPHPRRGGGARWRGVGDRGRGPGRLLRLGPR